MRVFVADDDAAVLSSAGACASAGSSGSRYCRTRDGRGLGSTRWRSAALGLVPVGEPLWAQVAPGNAASLRARGRRPGFVPVGAEVLVPAILTDVSR